jgi:hypothetical protein
MRVRGLALTFWGRYGWFLGWAAVVLSVVALVRLAYLLGHAQGVWVCARDPLCRGSLARPLTQGRVSRPNSPHWIVGGKGNQSQRL